MIYTHRIEWSEIEFRQEEMSTGKLHRPNAYRMSFCQTLFQWSLETKVWSWTLSWDTAGTIIRIRNLKYLCLIAHIFAEECSLVISDWNWTSDARTIVESGHLDRGGMAAFCIFNWDQSLLVSSSHLDAIYAKQIWCTYHHPTAQNRGKGRIGSNWMSSLSSARPLGLAVWTYESNAVNRDG